MPVSGSGGVGFDRGVVGFGLLAAGVVEADLDAAFSLLEGGVDTDIACGIRPCQRGSRSVGYCLTTA